MGAVCNPDQGIAKLKLQATAVTQCAGTWNLNALGGLAVAYHTSLFFVSLTQTTRSCFLLDYQEFFGIY
jgi:hypothetical protein